MIRYAVYLLRWAVLAIPTAILFDYIEGLKMCGTYLNMILSSVMVGAVFYFIDKRIFR